VTPQLKIPGTSLPSPEVTLSGWTGQPAAAPQVAARADIRPTLAHLSLGLAVMVLWALAMILRWQPPSSWTPLVVLGLLALIAQSFPVRVSNANVSVGVGFLLAACLLGGAAAGSLVVAAVNLVWSMSRGLMPWSRSAGSRPLAHLVARAVSFTAISGLAYLAGTELALAVFELEAPLESITLASLGASVVLAVSIYVLQNLGTVLISAVSGEDALGYLRTVIPIPVLAEFLALPAALLLAVAHVALGGAAFALLAWLYMMAALLGWRSWQDRETLKRRLEDVELLHQVGATLSGTLEIGELVRRLSEILRAVVRFQSMHLVIEDSSEHAAQCYVFDGSGRRGELPSWRLAETMAQPEGLRAAPDGNVAFTRDLPADAGASVRLRLDFEPGEVPSEQRLVLLDTICGQAGTALSNARLYRMANTDPLTGVAIRRYFERALRLVVEGGEPFAVIMLDIDLFKKVNDTYGHRAGDVVLRDLAVVLVGSLRVLDVPARYGGEEFVLLLPGAKGPEGAAVAERIRRTLELRCAEVDQHQIRYTASFGVAASNDVDIESDPMEVVWRADAALLEAKRAGRNQVVTYASLAIGGS